MLMLPDQAMATVYAADIAPHLQAGAALGFAHGFCHRLRPDSPPAGAALLPGGAQGAGRYVAGCPRLGRRRARPAGGDGRFPRQHLGPGGRLRPGGGLPGGRGLRHHLPAGMRQRSVRRAGRAVRGRGGIAEGRLRHHGGGGLRPGERLLRVRARAEAHHRSAASPWCGRHAQQNKRHCVLWRVDAGASHHRPEHPAPACARCCPRSRTVPSPGNSWSDTITPTWERRPWPPPRPRGRWRVQAGGCCPGCTRKSKNQKMMKPASPRGTSHERLHARRHRSAEKRTGSS